MLDIMLPGLDGWSVLRAIREPGNPVPVLFLTARDQVDDRVKGLELWADDYLVKPFAFSELLARVRSLLRRGQAKAPEVLRVADMELDLYPKCGGAMRIIACSTETAVVRRITASTAKICANRWRGVADFPPPICGCVSTVVHRAVAGGAC